MSANILSKQRGFTLIELVIVVVVVGFIALVMTRQFSGKASDSARAEMLYSAAQKLAGHWTLLTMVAGTSNNSYNSPIVGTSSMTGHPYQAIDTVINGKSHMATAYQKAWAQSGLQPLRSLAVGEESYYTIGSISVAIFGGGTDPLEVYYYNVPEDVVKKLWLRYGAGAAGTTGLGIENLTDAVIRYSSDMAGTRDVSIVVQK